ncbi:MAG: hypothetical protein HY461_02400 [Parcubacteria group bacterium]|nr:hypothetical protein [Parcubacteria group bacterium]
MMPTQQQPALDTPAVEQHPMIENVVEKARGIGTERSNVYLAAIFGYLCSAGIGAIIAWIFYRLFSPDPNATVVTDDRWLQVGIGISVLTSFVLGLLFPLLFARNRRMLAVLLTIILQFITLVVLVLIGLSQIPSTEIARTLVS